MFAKLANKRKLDEATSAKDDVTPIYLLDEITELVSSGGDAAQGMADATISRLSNKSPIVKQKVLRLIKHISNKGAPEYRRAICKQAKDVRELTHYKGEPDPFKGDVLNQKVRDAAKETLDAIFQATDNNYSSAASKPTLTNRIQGFGSANASDPVASSSYSKGPSSSSGGFSTMTSSGAGGGMVGFGNPRFNSSAKPSSSSNPTRWLPTNLANKLDSLNVLPKDRTKGLRHSEAGNHDGYSSGEDSRSGSTYSRPTIQQEPPTRSSLNTNTHASATPTSRQGGAGGAQDGAGDETQLVEDMCTPQGLRAQPDRETLRLFVENAASMSGPVVAQHLQTKMEEGSWQEVLRALCALEAVISQGSSAACGEIAVHFQAQAGVVREAMKSPQASVRHCGTRVFRLLGGDTLPEATASPAQASAAPQPDLMPDLLGTEEPTTATDLGDLLGGDMPTDNPPASSSGGMFAGLDVDISSNQQPAQPPNASFLDLGTSPAASHAAHQLSPMDALAALHSSGGTSTSTAQHQQTGSTSGNRPSANGTAQNADDLFGGLQTSASTAQGQQSGGDMFGGLSMQTRQSPVSAMNGTGGNSQGLLPGPGTAGAAAADLFGGLSLDGTTTSQSSANPAQAPSPAVDELEGLFTTAQPSSQAAQPQLQAPGPQPWQQSMGQAQPGQSMQGMQSMSPGMAMMMMQAGMGMQPGMGFAPGMMPPGMFQPGMMPPGMMQGAPQQRQGPLQHGQLGPGGMPSGAMPAFPTNPLQGLQGVPSAQMQYLARQVQGMGSMSMQQPLPGQQMPQGVQPQASAAGLSDLFSSPRAGQSAPQGSSPSAPGAQTDLLGRRLSSKTQNAFDFIGDHIRNSK